MSIKQPNVNHLITPSGEFMIEHWRAGKILNVYRLPNGVTIAGKNSALDVNFHSGAQISYWWIGLIDSIGYTAVAATDIYQNINKVAIGWSEFANYTDTNNGGSAVSRPLWSKSTASSQLLTNTTKALFNIATSSNIMGAFLVGGSTSQVKSDNTIDGNILWATALFSYGSLAVVAADELRITYTISL